MGLPVLAQSKIENAQQLFGMLPQDDLVAIRREDHVLEDDFDEFREERGVAVAVGHGLEVVVHVVVFFLDWSSASRRNWVYI